MTLFTQEKVRALLDAVADGKSMRQATAIAYGSRSKFGWVHIRNSRKERLLNLPPDQCRYWVCDWPEKNEGHHLCEAFQMALDIAKHDFTLETLAEIRQSTRPVVEGGKIQYEIDHQAIADWQGDAELARTLGGLHDPFYQHDETGARIPLCVRDRTSAQLTIAALKAVDGERWNVEQKINVRKKSTDVVLVLGEKREPKQRKPDNNLERLDIDELRRLANLPPKNPYPSGPVDLGNGGSSLGDPVERINNRLGDDSSRPMTPTLPSPPQPQPQQPVVSYARRRIDALDAVDRPGSNPMPNGGFAMNRFDSGRRPRPT